MFKGGAELAMPLASSWRVGPNSPPVTHWHWYDVGEGELVPPRTGHHTVAEGNAFYITPSV